MPFRPPRAEVSPAGGMGANESIYRKGKANTRFAPTGPADVGANLVFALRWCVRPPLEFSPSGGVFAPSTVLPLATHIMFKKILIANRGDIAVRVIRAAREMKIPTVAVYSQADIDSLHVRLADEAVCIGPPERKGSYLNTPNILSAAVITGCDAVHPGIGFLAEVASFAEMCDAIGLKYIGPPVRAIELMGDKIEARATMEKAGVPIVPGTNSALRDPLEAAKVATKVGFPVMIKAAGAASASSRTRRSSPRSSRPPRSRPSPPSATPTSTSRSSSRPSATSRSKFWPMSTARSSI